MLFGKKNEVSRIYIFEDMPATKAVLALGIPTIINQLINVIYNLADTYFVGQLNNPSMVAALSLSAPVMILLNAGSSLYIVGGCALISKALGEKNYKRAEDLATLCPLMALVTSIVITILSAVFIKPLAIFAGATETCLDYTIEYLTWVFAVSAIPNILGLTLGGVLRGRGYSKYEMFGITTGNILNIILDPIFVFTLNMGVKGAAVATFISNTVTCLLFIIFAIRFQKKEHLFTLKGFVFDKHLAKEVVTTGLPATVHLILGSTANILFMNQVKVYSDACIAGIGIVRKLEHVAGQIVIGLNQGIIPLISYNYGNKNLERMNKVRRTAIMFTSIFGILAILILIPFSDFFVNLFIADADTIYWGSRFLKVFAFMPLTMAYNNSCRTTFQALGRKKYSVLVSSFRNFFLYLPIMYTLNGLWGISGLIFTASSCDMIANTMSFFFMKKTMKEIENEFNA